MFKTSTEDEAQASLAHVFAGIVAWPIQEDTGSSATWPAENIDTI